MSLKLKQIYPKTFLDHHQEQVFTLQNQEFRFLVLRSTRLNEGMN